MFQTMRGSSVADVVVIGSGAGGGTVAHVLTSLGVRVTLLEAGPLLNPAKDYKEHKTPFDYPHRGAGPDGESYFGRKDFGFFSAPTGYWQIDEEPYTVSPGSDFRWFRSRILGGRTNHYGRITLRFADYDFKPSLLGDGLGDDWPVTYGDIAPYYDTAERFIGVCGTREGIRSAPDGEYLPAPAPRVHEVLIQKSSARLGIPCIPSRMAILTRPHNGRPACHYCAECGRGCITASNYSSSQVQIMPALKTGRLTIVANAMAREILTDSNGRASAVSYVDKTTRTEKQIRCRVVVLAASACESTRLLLNSKSSRHSNGLANSSGVVGRNLTDTVGYSLSGHVPALAGMPKHNSDGYSGGHLYMPWFGLEKKNKDFPRGYHIEIGGGYNMPMVGSFNGVCRAHEGYGSSLRKAILENYGCTVGFSGRGEMIPNPNSYCEIDPHVVDRWGIPVLRFSFQWSDHELKMVRHMHDTFASIIEGMGGRVLGPRSLDDPARAISQPGAIIHELGTVRMGSDPKTSALNQYGQAHDAPNLFVADAAPFVTNPDKNPTLTICAMAWRASEYIADSMKKGDL
ncbi:MAG: GMC family oxidoreductase [Acidobacteria bacterium]|nr:GMC family oxidoreductase [Acidobacteriota bacterium]